MKFINSSLKVLVCLLLFAAMCTNSVYAEEACEEPEELYARSAVLMDADSGRILFSKEGKNAMPMASTTKIMTCIVALENMEERQICDVSDYAEHQPKVHLGVKKGEQYYLEDLLYSLMLESHNDSAVIIAETIAGSVESFADMMNKKAEELGCSDTYFITPNGLDAEDEQGVHSTTAAELALIMKYCINDSPEKERFLSITQQKTYEFTDISGQRSFVCSNHNAFLEMMDGALSGKTGFTADAGYCYVGALRSGERTFIVALLACGWPNNKGYKWSDTRTLMEYALTNYEYRNVWKAVEYKDLWVQNGVNENNPFESSFFVKTTINSNDRELKVLLRKDEKVQVEVEQISQKSAPVSASEKTGTVTYYLGENVLKQYDIVTVEGIEEETVFWWIEVLERLYLL